MTSSPGGGSASASSGAGTTSVVVGALPVIDTAGLQVAIKEGYFRQAGLNVTVQAVTQSTSAIPDLLHGSIDIIGGANDGLQVILRPRIAVDPYATGVPGVYLCSQSAPPGAGIHGLCGYHAATAALRRLRG